MSKKVTVEIQISERVKYNRRVEMTQAEFEQLDKRLEEARGKDLRDVEEQIAEHIDRQADWLDSDDIEIDEFRIVEPD